MMGQLMRFGVIGVIATVIHVAIALLLHHLIGVSPLWSNAIAFITAWMFSYVGNRVWTFESETRHTRAIPRYFLVSCCGFALNQLIVFVTVSWWGWPFWLALACAVTIVPLISFTASRYWAYGQSEAA